MRRASSILTATTEPLQEVEGDEPAQSLQAEPSLSKKWKETGQLSPNRRNRASPRSGRRLASSVLAGGAENLQEVETDGPAPSLTGGAENLQEVEGDGPAQSLQAEPSLSKKWKEMGQLSPYRRSRETPRFGRRRASSVPTPPTEPLQEVEGDGPAQSLQAEPSLSQKWKETGQLSPTAPTEPLQEVEGDGPAQSLQAEPRISKKWKETGQLSPYKGTEPLPEVEGDGPALSP